MPASSVSAMNSWGVYLVAAAALVLLLVPALQQVSADARVASDWRVVDGVSRVINNLRPGMRVVLRLPSNSTDAVLLHAFDISCNDGRGTIRMTSRWLLPDFAFVPGVLYTLTLDDASVEVAKGV